MSVTVPGWSGLTNAYTSVESATGSLAISGASRCDDMAYLWFCSGRGRRWPATDDREGDGGDRQGDGWEKGEPGHGTARASRAANCGSCRMISLVPENRPISPVLRSRMWATRGSLRTVEEASASAIAASAAPTSAGPCVSTTPSTAGRPGMAERAPAATTAAEPPFRNERRLKSLTGTSSAGKGQLVGHACLVHRYVCGVVPS